MNSSDTKPPSIATSEPLKAAYYREIRKRVFIYSSVLGFSALGAVAAAYMASRMSAQFLGMIAGIACILSTVVSFCILCKAVYRLLSGPPQASTDPEGSVQAFLKASLPGHGHLTDRVNPDGVFYLTEEARNDIGGLQGYKKYCETKYAEAVNSLPKKNHAHYSSVNGLTVKSLPCEGESRRYSADVSISTTFGCQASTATHEGPFVYRIEADVVCVAGRWYLTSGKWAGVVVK